MFELLTSVIISASACSAAGFEASDCWTPDRTTVIQGGCLTIIVHGPCRESQDLMLQINEREPKKLLDGIGPVKSHIGPTGDAETLLLLYQELSGSDSFEQLPDDPESFRPVGIFSKPGTVRLTLYDGDASLGTKVITILRGSSETNEAADLLRPRLGRKYRGQRNEILWTQLITHESLGITPPLTDHEVHILREQLPIITKHPDWEEIAEMSLLRLETRHHANSLVEEIDGQSHLKAGVEDLDPPKHIVEARNRKLKSPFAQAIQHALTEPYGSLRAIKTWDEQQKRLKVRN